MKTLLLRLFLLRLVLTTDWVGVVISSAWKSNCRVSEAEYRLRLNFMTPSLTIQWKLHCRSQKQKRKNQPIKMLGIEHCDWFILTLLLPTPTMQFSLNRKRRSHKWSRYSASDTDRRIGANFKTCPERLKSTQGQDEVKVSLFLVFSSLCKLELADFFFCISCFPYKPYKLLRWLRIQIMCGLCFVALFYQLNYQAI